MKYFVYIVRCADNTFYTGITTDIKRRIDEHNGKDKGAKYTKVRRPVKLVYSSEFPDRSSATKEEMRIKKMTRKQKENLLKS
jgi:putative endonuclease